MSTPLRGMRTECKILCQIAHFMRLTRCIEYGSRLSLRNLLPLEN